MKIALLFTFVASMASSFTFTDGSTSTRGHCTQNQLDSGCKQIYIGGGSCWCAGPILVPVPAPCPGDDDCSV